MTALGVMIVGLVGWGCGLASGMAIERQRQRVKAIEHRRRLESIAYRNEDRS